uniref:Uncharacterized protein n=1 Tax=Triticum urartu TaxID=4572 RepID=A0A8R7RBJ8_TRIUA
MARFMAQILAHNRHCSTLVYGIRRTPDMFNKFMEEKEPSPRHGALHQHHDQASPQAKIDSCAYYLQC